MMRGRQSVHLFFEVEGSQLFEARRRQMRSAAEGATRRELESHEDLASRLAQQFQIEPLRIDFDNVNVSHREEGIPAERHPRSNFLVDHMRGRSFPRQVITFHIPYSGNRELLRCIPNPRVLSAPEVFIDDEEITFDVIDFYNDAERVKREADQIIGVIRKQAANLENNVKEFNASISGQITSLIDQRQEQLESQSKVVESLGYPVKPPRSATTQSPQVASGRSPAPHKEWDVFISHASEDKDTFVRQLADALKAHGIRVWYDDFTLRMGDSLRRSIDEGLSKSRYGIVVLSPRFFAKEWPQKELDGLVVRERNGEKVILPVWLDVEANDVARYSPTLADRVAAKARFGIEAVVTAVLGVVRATGT